MKTILKNDPTEKLEETYKGAWRLVWYFKDGGKKTTPPEFASEKETLSYHLSKFGEWENTWPKYCVTGDNGNRYQPHHFSHYLILPVGDA